MVTGQPYRVPRGDQVEAAQPTTVPARSEAAQREDSSTAQEDTSQNRAGRETGDVQEVYRDLIASVAEAYAAQKEVSLADARQYLASGLNNARNIKARFCYLQSVMEDLAIADDSRLDILEAYAARPSSAAPPRGGAPAASTGPADRAPRATTYDNRFRFGVAKDGVPYFSRGGKPRRTDEGSATLTQEEAVEYFRLYGTDKAAWIDFKHELYRKYRAA